MDWIEYDKNKNIMKKINYEKELFKEYYEKDIIKFEGKCINGKKW